MKGTPIKMLLLSGNQGNPAASIAAWASSRASWKASSSTKCGQPPGSGPGLGDWATDGGLKAAGRPVPGASGRQPRCRENDSMVLGAVQAAKAAGLDGILFAAAADGQREALEMIKEGTYAPPA